MQPNIEWDAEVRGGGGEGYSCSDKYALYLS